MVNQSQSTCQRVVLDYLGWILCIRTRKSGMRASGALRSLQCAMLQLPADVKLSPDVAGLQTRTANHSLKRV